MSKRLLLLVTLLALIFLSSAAQAQGTNVDPSQTAILAGGAYRLSITSQPVTGVIRSDRYQLAPSLSADASGCCCKGYLPCIKK